MLRSLSLKHRESGQGLVEYVVLIVFLAIALIVGLNLLSSGIVAALYNNIIVNL